MKCKKDIIIKVYFEIQNYDYQIVYKIIEKYGYPDKNKHMQEHSNLIEQVLKFKLKLNVK